MGSVLAGQVRNAIKDYKMIEDGDRIAIGVSGGKDSLALLHVLANQRRYLPVKFELKAFTVALGYDDFDTKTIASQCKTIDVPYEVINTHIKEVVFDVRKESNPCSLCANMRRGALNDTLQKQGFNKVVLGHNKDDLLETFLMSMFYEGRLNTFSPITYLSKKNIYVIRPLAYSYEKDVRYYININKLITINNPCTVDGKTTRSDIRQLIRNMSLENPHYRANLFGVIKRNHISGW